MGRTNTSLAVLQRPIDDVGRLRLAGFRIQHQDTPH
jgi:hypothetical protein